MVNLCYFKARVYATLTCGIENKYTFHLFLDHLRSFLPHVCMEHLLCIRMHAKICSYKGPSVLQSMGAQRVGHD